MVIYFIHLIEKRTALVRNTVDDKSSLNILQRNHDTLFEELDNNNLNFLTQLIALLQAKMAICTDVKMTAITEKSKSHVATKLLQELETALDKETNKKRWLNNVFEEMEKVATLTGIVHSMKKESTIDNSNDINTGIL